MYLAGYEGDPVARYFFHIRTDGILIPDEEGMLFLDVSAAIDELRASACDLSAASKGGSVEMVDSKGVVLQTMLATIAIA